MALGLPIRFSGKQKLLSLGPYLVVGLADARAKREAAKKLLASAVDPAHWQKLERQSKADSNANTFEGLANEFLAKNEREGKSTATMSKKRWLVSLALPNLGNRPISDITASEVLVPLRKVEAQGNYETARRLRAVISQVFRYAIATAKAENDPTFGLKGAEIDPWDTQNGVKALSPGGVPDELVLCSGIRLENGLPQLHEPEAQEQYLQAIEEQEAEVVVLDNLCSIVTSGSISDDDVWLPIQPFLNKLRQRGVAVIIVHHAGKNGDYLGSSRMTQNLDTVIKLEKPQSHDLQNGAVFSIRFEKGRSVYGNAASGVFARLVEGPEGNLDWDLGELSSRDSSEEAMTLVVDAMQSKQYINQTEVARAVGMPQSRVSTLLSQAVANGYIGKTEARDTFKEVKELRRLEEELSEDF